MDSTRGLNELIRRLRLHKPRTTLDDDDDDDAGEDFGHESGGKAKVLAESSSSAAAAAVPRDAQPPRFRPKRAAVLICLFQDEVGELRVILTKRSSNLSTHSGEVSLPGGKADEGDKDDVDTALREAKEEIGLEPSLITVVTTLEPFLSRHLLRVAPVIGVLSDRQLFKPVLNACEVEAIFDAPLEMFLKDQKWRSEEREWMGEKYLVHYFDFKTKNKKFVIWGLTATILIHAATVVYERAPSFPERKPTFRIPRYLKEGSMMP